jgi:hypothetical protein
LYALQMRSERVLPFLTRLAVLDGVDLEWPRRMPSAGWTVPAHWTFDSEKYDG